VLSPPKLIKQSRYLIHKEQPIVKSARAILTLLEEDGGISEKTDLLVDSDPTLEELSGSEPQAQDIFRRRYDI
jgi:hypothetical protein